MMYDLGIESREPGEGDVGEETGQTRPALQYDAHGDAIGAVAFHPLEPLLLSVSGSRHFDDAAPTASVPGDLESDSDSSDGSKEGSREDVGGVSRLRERPRPSVRDASVKMWGFREPEGS